MLLPDLVRMVRIRYAPSNLLMEIRLVIGGIFMFLFRGKFGLRQFSKNLECM